MHGARWLLPLALAAGACARGAGEVDREREALLAADRAHAEVTEARGVPAGFVSRLADDAVYLQPGAAYVRGRAAIGQLLAGRVPPGAGVRWRAVTGAVSTDATVGDTAGWTELTVPGRPTAHGNYIAFWRRAEGDWSVDAWSWSAGAAPRETSALPWPVGCVSRWDPSC